MKYLTGIYWERGGAAKSNQDSVVLLQVLTARGRVVLASVCDGMGGLAQGEMASGYVTQRLQEWFYESLLYAVRRRKPYWMIRRSLDRLVYHMQEQLSQYSRQETVSLGTTMTVLILWEKTYLIWHLGDSRIYQVKNRGRGRQKRRRESDIICLTKDHAKGKNVLTKCVGSFGYERPDFQIGSIGKGQAMLVCSDGFRHCVTRKELSDVLLPDQIQKEEQILHRLQEIGGACMKRGERDNMSAIYIKCEE